MDGEVEVRLAPLTRLGTRELIDKFNGRLLLLAEGKVISVGYGNRTNLGNFRAIASAVMIGIGILEAMLGDGF